jgi:hypothetical protein
LEIRLLRIQNTINMFAKLAPSVLLVSLAAAQGGFSGYPAPALSCLEQANAASGCDTESDPTLFNNCVCSNTGGSITNFAICLTQTDSNDIEASYNTYNTNCASTGTPMSVSLSQFIALGKSGSTSGSSRGCRPLQRVKATDMIATEQGSSAVANTMATTVVAGSTAYTATAATGGTANTVVSGGTTTVTAIIRSAGVANGVSSLAALVPVALSWLFLG